MFRRRLRDADLDHQVVVHLDTCRAPALLRIPSQRFTKVYMPDVMPSSRTAA
jgi:hypothetical protein